MNINKNKKNKISLTICTLLFILFGCAEVSEIDPSSLSTNPQDCKISKIYFDNKTSGSYDVFKYNLDGTVSKIDSYESGSKFLSTDYTYSDGKLVNQKNGSIEVKYSYASDGDLVNAELLDGQGSKIGDLNITLNSSKQIIKLTVKNPNSTYANFKDATSNFTYDANGNTTLIEIKASNGLRISTSEYSSFVGVRSFYTTLKGVIFENFTSPIDFLQNPFVYKYPNSTPNQFKRSSILDANLMPTSNMKIILDVNYTRNNNESGLLTERITKNNLSSNTSTNYYEYTGCK